MILLPYSRPWDAQPQEAAAPAWGHPLLRNVLAFVDPYSGTERVTGAAVSPAFSGARMGYGPGGYGFYTGSGSKWTFAGRAPSDPTNNRKVSIFAVTSIITTPTEFLTTIVGTQSPNQNGLRTAASGNAAALQASWAGVSVSAGHTLAGGTTIAALFRSDRIAANTLQGAASQWGQSAPLSTAGGSAGTLSYPTVWEIGGDTRASYETSRYIEQVLHFAVVVNDYWSQADFDSLVNNPWQLFEPQRIWVPVSAGGGINASVTLTGCSAASAAGATVALGSATAALSGASSAASAGTVTASAGSSASITLTGASATSTAGSLTAGGSAGISLAGVGAAGAAGAVTATAGGAASVTLTGASASAAAGILAGFGGAQITLTGASASGAAGSASASAGSGSGTGATAAEIWSYTLSSGLTAEATLVAIHTMLSELHLIHGLTAGSPLSVTVASRAAGAVSQAVAEAAGTVTVTRQ